MASTMVVPPSKHTLFMRGFTTRQNIDKIREFFTREAGGCTVEFFKESENRERLFVALRFDTKDIARDILNRYDQGEVLGDRISISWFKDLRRARQKAAAQGGPYHRRDRDRDRDWGQYKSNYRPHGDFNGPSQNNNWQRQNSGSGGRNRNNSGRRYERSSSRSRSRSASSSRTYSRSRSRSHSPSRDRSHERERSHERDRSRDRDRSKSRSRSYSRSRDRSKSVESRRSRSPPPPNEKHREREDSTDRSVHDRSPTDRSNGASGYEKQPRNRWEDSKNGNNDSFLSERNGNGHYDHDGHDRDSYDRDRNASPPRGNNRQVRSAVTTVDREDGYEESDYAGDEAMAVTTPMTSRRYSGGQMQASPGSAPVRDNTSRSGGGDHASPNTRESDPDIKGTPSASYHRSSSRNMPREHDVAPSRGDRSSFPSSDRERSSTERYPNQSEANTAIRGATETNPGGGSGRDLEPSAHRSRSPSVRSDPSHPDQDHYDDRRTDRKRSLSGDDHGRYIDGGSDQTKKSRYIDEEKVEKVKRPMGKRTRGAETMEETEVDDRDLPDRGALGLPHDKMVMVREKKEEIEKAYRQDCETFAAVVKMLVSKDSDLESKLQQSLRENLKEIGQRCIQELREFINKVKVEDHS